MSDLMLDTELQDEQREMTENIQRSANGLLTVINDVSFTFGYDTRTSV